MTGTGKVRAAVQNFHFILLFLRQVQEDKLHESKKNLQNCCRGDTRLTQLSSRQQNCFEFKNKSNGQGVAQI